METKSSLTLKRVFITTALYFSIPVFVNFFDSFIYNLTISYTLLMSIVGFINITYNWNLFALHYNRSKKAIGDTVFFTIVGTILIGVLTYINVNYIYGEILLADRITVLTYYGGAPLMLLVLTFIFSFNSLITFKCLIDRIKITSSTLQMILFSGLLFGLLYSIFYIPFDINIQIPSFLYHSMLYMICSYLYNQSRTIVPSLLSISFVLLTVNIINIYL